MTKKVWLQRGLDLASVLVRPEREWSPEVRPLIGPRGRSPLTNRLKHYIWECYILITLHVDWSNVIASAPFFIRVCAPRGAWRVSSELRCVYRNYNRHTAAGQDAAEAIQNLMKRVAGAESEMRPESLFRHGSLHRTVGKREQTAPAHKRTV